MRLRRLLVTDADNTLWDTDEVYAAAQLNLLRSLEESYHISVETDDRLQYVRRFDQALASCHPKGLLYPVDFLIKTMVLTILGGEMERAVTEVLRIGWTDPRAELIADAFMEEVSREVPRLRAGVATAVPQLAACGIRIIVFTEGDMSRCTRLLEQHSLSQHVLATISEDKTFESYEGLRRRFCCIDRPVMIGDQIDRDIELSKLAGYTTVYFPGGFNPVWTRERHVAPDFVITNFEEVITIMGVDVSPASGSERRLANQ